jgi:hypothetical protein
MAQPARYYDLEDEDEEDRDDPHRIVRDGEKVVVRAQLMDAADREFLQDLYSRHADAPGARARAAALGIKISDARGLADPLSLRRPGFRGVLDSEMSERRDREWERVGERLRDAWKTPPASFAPEARLRGQHRPQDARDATPGYRSAAEPSDRSTASPVATADGFKSADVQRAYEERGRAISEAWKG